MWLSCFAQDHFITHTRKIYKDGISCAAARGINLHNMCAAWEAEDAHWRAPPIMITGRQKSLILKAKMLGRLMAGNRLHLYHAAVVIRFLILSCALMHWWQPSHQEESEIWSFNGGDCRKAECTFFLAVCQCDQAVHLFEDLSWLVSKTTADEGAPLKYKSAIKNRSTMGMWCADIQKLHQFNLDFAHNRKYRIYSKFRGLNLY